MLEFQKWLKNYQHIILVLKTVFDRYDIFLRNRAELLSLMGENEMWTFYTEMVKSRPEIWCQKDHTSISGKMSKYNGADQKVQLINSVFFKEA